MKILVAGASGFIGNALLKKLADRKHEIVVLTRSLEKSAFQLPVLCKAYEWTPESGCLPIEALDGIDAVVNLAGENIASGRWSTKRKRSIENSRVLSVRNLISAMKNLDQKPKVFLSASAIGLYGDYGDNEVDENSPSNSNFLSDVCKKWETEIFKAEELGIRTLAFRIGMVLGHDGGALQKMLPPFQMGVGGKLGSGKNWMSWIHLEDLTDMILHALDSTNLSGPVNAISPNPETNEGFTEILGKVLKRPTFFSVPSLILKIALGELSSLLLASQKVSSKKISRSGFSFKFPDLEQALTEIYSHKFHEIHLEQWIQQPIEKTYSFFKEAKNLELLTPDFLKFRVLNQSSKEIQKGAKINYCLWLRFIPFWWQSQIVDWEPNSSFSDKQLHGPYSHWFHTHEFIEKNGGTLIRDKISYRVPFGIIGDVVSSLFIKKDLEKIFSYRKKVIEEIFN
jgi:uncharacterized protein